MQTHCVLQIAYFYLYNILKTLASLKFDREAEVSAI